MKIVGSLYKKAVHFAGNCREYVAPFILVWTTVQARRMLQLTTSVPLPFDFPYMLIVTLVAGWVITVRKE